MADLELVKGDDGGVYLVGTSDGARLVFGSVNASQVQAARIAQNLTAEPDSEKEEKEDDTVDPAGDMVPDPAATAAAAPVEAAPPTPQA